VNVVDATAVATVVMAGVGTVFIPVWLQRRKRRAEAIVAAEKLRAAADATSVVSWQSLTIAIQKERDDIRAQLKESEARSRERVQEIESDWEKRMAIAKGRITDMETEIVMLRKELRIYTNDDG
jgi:hypothetical protein